jgi:hypothetical protein
LQSQPARAHELAFGDGRITAAAARQLAGPEANSRDRAKANALARQALIQDPTAVVAVATLGLNSQIGGKAPLAKRLFAYADRLSRREIQTQLWLIEEAVSRGDIAGALLHYDVALRTSRTAPQILFPVLSSAISDARIRNALLNKIIAGAPWGVNFIDYASINSDPIAAADLLEGLTRRGVTLEDEARARVLVRLTTIGKTTAAWRYYSAMNPRADPRRSRDARFSTNLEIPSPFDWTPINDPMGISSSIQRGSDGAGVFDFHVPATGNGPILRQLQVLPPGSYRLIGRSNGIDQAADARPYWSLSCSDGKEIGRVEVPNSKQNGGVFSGRFVVPSGCTAQTLALIARASDAVGGVSGQIDRAELGPE